MIREGENESKETTKLNYGRLSKGVTQRMRAFSRAATACKCGEGEGGGGGGRCDREGVVMN